MIFFTPLKRLICNSLSSSYQRKQWSCDCQATLLFLVKCNVKDKKKKNTWAAICWSYLVLNAAPSYQEKEASFTSSLIIAVIADGKIGSLAAQPLMRLN